MSFEVSKSAPITVKIYGAEYKLSRPTLSMVKEYTSAIDQEKESSSFEPAINLLSKLGLPSSVSSELEFDHAVELIKFLTESLAAKKN
jgi:hypothetical protein